MAEISTIQYQEIIDIKRFDAEYFKPEYIYAENIIKQRKYKLLNELIKTLTDYHANGSYQILSENVTLLRKPDFALMVRTVDFEKDDFEKDVIYLSKASYDFLEKTKMYGGEIVINKIGNAGKVYFLPNLNRPVSLGMNQFMIRTNSKINNYYLYVFLISSYGRKVIERRITGAVPLSIDKKSIKSVPVPIFNKEFQEQIENIVKKSNQSKNKSKEIYQLAEQLLLKEIGLSNYTPNHILTFTSTKKEIDNTKRYDAEYFQPKYAKIINKIENYSGGFDIVKNIVNWEKGVEVGTEAYTETGKDFIRVSDFSIFGIESVSRKISNELFEILKDDYQPKKDEILFTKDGTIGISYVVKEEIEGVLSGAFLRLTLKEKYKNFEKEVLALILNSMISKMQIEQLSGGALIAHLKPSDFEKIRIPIIKPEIQKEIAEKINESHKLRKESKELLEKAKRMVEEEIEKE